jgi:glycosyltransferase involved in cell wall biosynthesis
MAAYLEECVNSVKAQTYQNIEILVVNDGSTDRTGEIGDAVVDGRTQVLHCVNAGVAESRNRGLRLARGEYICFLDADDTFYPEKVEFQVANLTETGASACGTYMHYAAANGRRAGLSGQDPARHQREILEAKFMPFPISSIMFSRGAIERTGEFDVSVPNVEDLEFLSRVAETGSIVVIPRPQGTYRVHSRSSTSTQHARQQHARDWVVLRSECRRRDVPFPTFETYLAEAVTRKPTRHDLATQTFRSAGVALMNGHGLVAVKEIGRALVADPLYVARRLRLRLRRVS